MKRLFLLAATVSLGACAHFQQHPNCAEFETRTLPYPIYHGAPKPRSFGGQMRPRLIWIQEEERVCVRLRETP